MSADRYTFGVDNIGALVLIGRGGALIRARDSGPVAHAAFEAIAQLRADLAAAVAERNQLRARAPSRAAGRG